MPTPLPNESEKDYLDRCMAYPDLQKHPANQRAAICHSLFEQHAAQNAADAIAGGLRLFDDAERHFLSTVTQMEAPPGKGSPVFSCNAQQSLDIEGMLVAGGHPAPAGSLLVADDYKAYVEFYLSHAFPVVTIDGTAIYPQVVANSYRSMLGQVFDFNHMVKSYYPKSEGVQDRVYGSVVAVQFTGVGVPPSGGPAEPSVNATATGSFNDRPPEGGTPTRWRVQPDRAAAPGIRCVASLGKAIEGVIPILNSQLSGRRSWTVSMENSYWIEDGGFAIKRSGNAAADQRFQELHQIIGEDSAWSDLAALGYDYIPWGDAPTALRGLFALDKASQSTRITGDYLGRKIVYLIGGLNGTISYRGVGICELGKEKEARLGTLLASAGNEEGRMQKAETEALTAPLRATVEAFEKLKS